MANNSISLVSLDFDTLKNQLKTYLRGQAQFSDYDFDGSNMSVLLDILTYNSHLNAFYLNMVASEMFLDSAQLRNSAVSIAKALNYTPRSAKSAVSFLDLRFPQSGLSSFTIPVNTKFTGKNSNGSFTFITGESIVLYPSNGAFTVNSLPVYEGSVITDTFVMDYAIENQRFILSNKTIDTSSISVLVSEDNGQTNTLFSRATTLFGLDASSNSYFIQATDDLKYEVAFGDGTFGRIPKDGSTLVATYRITVGTKGNGTTNFVLNDNLGTYNGYTNAIIPTINVAQVGFGGGSAETLEEIRFRAPRAYQTQQRAITISDYSTLIVQEFSDVKDAYVYGGETILGSPQYGKVFITPLTYSGERLSSTEKTSIETFMKDRCPLGIQPVIIDSDYLYIIPVTVVKYQQSKTQSTPSDISAAVKQAIESFNETQLNAFNIEYKSSKLEAAIDNSHLSISSNQTEITLKKLARLQLNSITFPTAQFRNAIIPGSFYSSEFTSNGRKYQYTDFNPNNNTFTTVQLGNEIKVINSSSKLYLKDLTVSGSITYTEVGSINYSTGTASLNSIVISDFIGKDGIEFFAKPVSEDVTATQNDILAIEVESIQVTVRQS
jgi:hypothetical protein